MNTTNVSSTSRKPGGVPTPDLKYKGALRQLTALVEAEGSESLNFFHGGFLPVLDAVLSKLIEWTERTETSDLKEWSGRALADRVRFLSSQKSFWQRTNAGFEERWAEFGDLRGARRPETWLAWRAGDYLWKLVSSRNHAHLYLSPMGDNSFAIVDLSPDFDHQKKWLERLIALPNFDEKSWREWAAAVFDRMAEDEDAILARSELKGKRTRDSSSAERRASAKVKLYDWKKTIFGAVKSLAGKPVGSIPGITRPPP